MKLKKKTGLQIDSFGNEINNNETNSNNNYSTENNFDSMILSKKVDVKYNDNDNKKNNNKYKEIDSYKPSGNLIYEEDLFKKMKIN